MSEADAPATDPPRAPVPPGDRKALLRSLRPHALGMGLVLFIVAIQQAAWLAEPAVFGDLLDAVISLPREGVTLLDHLPIWIAVFAINTVAGVVRRIASERVYGRVNASVARALSAGSKGESPARIGSLAELGRELVSFFEDQVPDALLGLASLLGAMIALFAYDYRIGLVCLLVSAPLAVVSRIYDRRVSGVTTELNALREMNTEVFTGDPDAVHAHYTRVAALKRTIGTYSALNFGMLRAALLAVFIVVLYVAIDLDDLGTGALYSITTYLWTFVTSIEDLPVLMENLTGVRDLWRRISGRLAPTAVV